MTIEVTAYERPHRLASSTHLPNMDIDGNLTFEPLAGGTRMRWSWEVRPRGVLKLMSPTIGKLGQRQERVIWAGLKRLLEAQVAPPQ